MKTYSSGRTISAIAALAAAALLGRNQATAEEKSSGTEIAVPIVMETATVRGKIIMLEDRKTDRQVLKDLKVSVWTTKEVEDPDEPSVEQDKLVHETTTDEFGMFDLPQLSEGAYVLILSDMKLRLVVIPKAEERADQKEPKVLLILLPKEVVEP